MDLEESRLARNASAKALFVILGMLGGLLAGAIRAQVGRVDELTAILLVARGGFIGSVFGVGVAIATATVAGRRSLASIKGLMGVVVVAALLFSCVIGLLLDLAAQGIL